MKNVGKWVLSAAVTAGALGLGTTTAQAAQFGVYVRSGSAYVPPCPGPGYAWAAGYYDGGYWVPGRWNFVGEGRDFDRDGYANRYREDRVYRDRDDFRGRDFDHDRDRNRGWDRDRGGDRDRDHARGNNGYRDHDRR